MDESGKAKNVVHTDEKIIYKCIFQHFSKIIDMVIRMVVRSLIKIYDGS